MLMDSFNLGLLRSGIWLELSLDKRALYFLAGWLTHHLCFRPPLSWWAAGGEDVGVSFFGAYPLWGWFKGKLKET